MRNFEELKQLLTEVKNNDYAVPSGVNVDDVIADMLKFIGHTDAELRDKLIYTTFMQWAEYKGIITPTKMKEILEICLSDTHLFYGIGEADTDSVFTRAFSALVISVALFVHGEIEEFLSADDLIRIKDIVLRYVEQEKDYRGYVVGKGWAHSIAHIADVLVNLSCCKVDGEYPIGRDGMAEILQAVKNLICNKEYIYVSQEDERLLTTFLIAGDKDMYNFANAELIDWIDSFNMADNEYWKGTMPDDFNLLMNRKNFMRSLYFRLLPDDDYKEICEHMLGFLVEKNED